MDKQLEELINLFAKHKRMEAPDESAAGIVFRHIIDKKMDVPFYYFKEMPYYMAISLIPKFIGLCDENRSLCNVQTIFKLIDIKNELTEKRKGTSGAKTESNNKDNKPENKERKWMVFPSYTELLGRALKHSPLYRTPDTMNSKSFGSVLPYISMFPVNPSFIRSIFYEPKESLITDEERKKLYEKYGVKQPESADNNIIAKAIDLYKFNKSAGFDDNYAISAASLLISFYKVKLCRKDYLTMPYEMAIGLIDRYIKNYKQSNALLSENKELRRLLWDKSYLEMVHQYNCKNKDEAPSSKLSKEESTKEEASRECNIFDRLVKQSSDFIKDAELNNLISRDFVSILEIDWEKLNKENKPIPTDDKTHHNDLRKSILRFGIDIGEYSPEQGAIGLSFNPYLTLSDMPFYVPSVKGCIKPAIKNEESTRQNLSSQQEHPKSQPSTKDEPILTEATRILGGDRQADYGDPVQNFINIAKEANRWCDKEVTPLDCVNVHIATKTCREQFKHKRDNQVDLVAYQEIKSRIIDWCATHDWKTE